MPSHEQTAVYNIPILVTEGQAMATLLLWDEAPEDPNEVKLRFEFKSQVLETRSERGYFRALCDLRQQLEASGLLVACYGGSENVYPSPMIESMGCGDKAYRLTLGMPARTQDLVSIFDHGDDVVPATVESQERFYELWLTSLQ